MRVLSAMSHMILQRCTTVARQLSTSIYTPYKQAIFQTRLDFQELRGTVALIPPHRMMCMLNIRLQLQELQYPRLKYLPLVITVSETTAHTCLLLSQSEVLTNPSVPS